MDTPRYRLPQVAFLRALVRCALRPALARAVPLYVMIALIGGAPLGALAHAARTSPAIVPALAALWLVLLARVRKPLFGATETEYLRSLPTPRPVLVAGLVLALLCIDAPWVGLCVATGDPALAVAGPALTLAGHAALAGRRATHQLALLGVLGAAAILPPWLTAGAALALAAIAVPWAWTVAVVPRLASTSYRSVAVPWIGIARALVASTMRANGELLRRLIVVLVVMTGAAALVIRNNRLDELDHVVRTCLVVLALGLPIVMTRIAARVLEVGWTLRWLYDATGARWGARSLGGLAAVIAGGSALGVLHAVAVALWSDASLRWWLLLIPAEAGAGAALAIVLLGLGAAAVTADGIEPFRFITGVIVATIAAAFTLADGLRSAAMIGTPAVVASAALYHLRVNRAVPCS